MAERRREDAKRILEGNSYARLSAVEDARTCAAAKALHGTVLGDGLTFRFPLPDCDALNCRCMAMPIPKELQHRRHPDWMPGPPPPGAVPAALMSD